MPLPLYPPMVGYVLANLRPCDAAEVWPVVPPSVGVQDLASYLAKASPCGRVFLHNGVPAAAVGAVPTAIDGVWGGWLFATGDWGQVWRDVVRFVRGDLLADVLGRGCHRMQVHSIAGHPDAGRLLRGLGFQREGLARAFGRGREDYECWARIA